MKLDTSAWIRIIVSSILIATTTFALKLISPLNPEWVYILKAICIVILFNKPESIKDSIVVGIIIGFLTGIFGSILFLAPLVMATIFLIIFSIIGAIMSNFVRKILF